MHGKAAYFRSFIFGVEDSLVSTVGLLSGIAIAGIESKTIFLTGVVLIFVEAFSMAAGTFLSEVSAEEYTNSSKGDSHSKIAGVVMFASYFVAGFVPLFPYIIAERDAAFPYSILASIATLFALGAWSGTVSRRGILRSALRMALVGGGAIAVGVAVGSYFG